MVGDEANKRSDKTGCRKSPVEFLGSPGRAGELGLLIHGEVGDGSVRSCAGRIELVKVASKWYKDAQVVTATLKVK